MSHAPKASPFARAEVQADGSTVVTVGGEWQADLALPVISVKGERIRVVAEGLHRFDSSLPAWLYGNFRNARGLDLSALPVRLQSLVNMAEKAIAARKQ